MGEAQLVKHFPGRSESWGVVAHVSVFIGVSACLQLCVCNACVFDYCRGQKKVSDSLGLELQMVVVSCCVGAGSQSLVLCKSREWS